MEKTLKNPSKMASKTPNSFNPEDQNIVTALSASTQNANPHVSLRYLHPHQLTIIQRHQIGKS